MSSYNRELIHLQAQGIKLSGLYVSPIEHPPHALIVTLHGGGNSAGYFDVVVEKESSFLETAATLGYAILSLNRPGYETSADIDPSLTSFDSQIEIITQSLRLAWKRYGKGSAGLYLIGHSIGGMLALSIAAAQPDDLPLLGVSTHSAGLVWKPGIPAFLRSLIKDENPITFPPEGRFGGYGPPWSWTTQADEQLLQTECPISVYELEDALVWPERLKRIAPQIKLPVQITIPAFDFMWSAEQAVRDQIKALFIHAPIIQVQKQRYSGHNLSANRAAKSFYLREIAFLAESRLHAFAAKEEK